ncbi:hypothetical protein J1N35_044353 [Gossypium stocksii]|uniref:Uncharacterized protein n=1 Tax=Gossypium stocksii TaxID=47602 RepID=A0A9D3ZFP5_9ROSI|nr:hypothetical protein J1N35_044353 [Gossypium stocksii]
MDPSMEGIVLVSGHLFLPIEALPHSDSLRKLDNTFIEGFTGFQTDTSKTSSKRVRSPSTNGLRK